MASNERKLVLQIEWKDGKVVTREIERTAESMKKLEKEADAVDKAFSKVKIGAASTGAAILLMGKKSMNEFIKGQDAILMMEGALQALGKYTPTASRRMQDLASAISKVSRYGDEQLLPFMTELLTIGNLNENQLGRTMKAAMDFSVVTGSLGTATMLLSKAAAGNTTLLARYGIVINETIPQAEKFEAVLKFIESRMGGLEQKMAGGLGGAFKQTTNAIGDMLEEGFSPWEASLQRILKLTREIAEGATKQMKEAKYAPPPLEGLPAMAIPAGLQARMAARTANDMAARLPSGAKFIPRKGYDPLSGYFPTVMGLPTPVMSEAGVSIYEGMERGVYGMNEFNRKQAADFAQRRGAYNQSWKQQRKEVPGLTRIPYEFENMQEPLENLGTVAEDLQDKYLGFGTALSGMFANITSGSASAGQAMKKAMLSALAEMAMKKGEFWVLEGAAQLAAMNPGGAVMIAKGLAMMALAGGLAGGASRGGRSGAAGGGGYSGSGTTAGFGGYGNYNSGPRIVVITADGRNIASGTNVDTVLSRAGIDRQLRNRILEQSRTGALAPKAS